MSLSPPDLAAHCRADSRGGRGVGSESLVTFTLASSAWSCSSASLYQPKGRRMDRERRRGQLRRALSWEGGSRLKRAGPTTACREASRLRAASSSITRAASRAASRCSASSCPRSAAFSRPSARAARSFSASSASATCATARDPPR
jgi:hypothetical protein